ncbi:Gfo/Idh/MocA family protein [Haladaptatus pallidirubidus]|uniref:Gfo/Idh/MocA family oxidoreductase n=1 Tax=Haladaptatus pallidirubidus TaxID=1008152 RepID=A0AAV3UQ26_9EURY|nr:Gfo/Idh/MocA family oxidoreductase [Haladaptatus pallidirubidus]
MSFKVAFIGTGPEPDNPVWGESAAMAYRHADGYQRLSNCRLHACADIVRENATAFADEFGIPHQNVFENFDEMLQKTEPDIVSIATPVPTHADIVIDAAKTDVVTAIHCEKPMANTWRDSKQMTTVCKMHDVQLTFNHQRRFAPEWRHAKKILEEGVVGELKRVEMSAKNLFDWGTHLIDLANFYNDERDPEWVMGGLDYRVEDIRYGSHNENQAMALWRYDNGVHGLCSTGSQNFGPDLVGCKHRLDCTEGMIEVAGKENLRYRPVGDEEWTTVDIVSNNAVAKGIEHIVKCIDNGTDPELSADNALRAMELIFGAYESVRARRRVEFPLDIDDNPLQEMVEAGELHPHPNGN